MPSKFAISADEENDWKELFALRERVLPELEKARQLKLIGKSLEAKITLTAGAVQLAAAQRHTDVFRELLNVSQLTLVADDAGMRAEVAKADGTKCERCWHVELNVGQHPEHPTICGRCVEAVQPAN